MAANQNGPLMKRLQWFATKSDLMPGIAEFESRHRVKYVLWGWYDENLIPEYESALDIPNLGVTAAEGFGSMAKHIVLPADIPVYVKTITLNAGGFMYDVDPRDNLSGFFVQFAGMYDSGKLIGGGCFFNSEEPEVRARCFEYAVCITEGFTQVRDPLRHLWQVGPEALEMLKQGVPVQTNDSYPLTLSPDGIAKRPPRQDIAALRGLIEAVRNPG